ncbi:MAG: Imm50 family immunity protein [Planctomycetota bacterium]
MRWINSIDNSEFLRRLFPEDPPLEAVGLHRVQLKHDGPIALFDFDLSDYPTNPPQRWVEAGANTVRVCLMGIGIRLFDMRGWSTNNIGRLEIDSSSGARILFRSAECQIAASFEFLRIDSVNAYRDGTRTHG